MDEIGKFFGYKSSPDRVEGNEAGGKSKHIYDFDPSGLERAAKSAKVLKDDPNSARILDMAVAETANRRLELLKEQKALDLKIEMAKQEAMKQQHEYSVAILKEESKTHRVKAEYEDFLARKRQEDRLEIEKKSQLEFLKIQEESVRKQEELRRQTIDYEFSKKSSDDILLSEKFWKNKAMYKRETKDLKLEKKFIDYEYQIKVISSALASVGNMTKETFNFFEENKMKFVYFVAGLALLRGGLTLSRRGVEFGMKQLEVYVLKPKLFKEHKFTRFDLINKSKVNVANNFESEGLVYDKITESILKDIIIGTQNSYRNKGQFRNYLFYGPPGTGKTLFAKKLALSSGLNYAIMAGGDVLPLQENAVTELHKVFNYSNRSKGTILFLDEADAFLKRRDQVKIGEELRSALNTFLYRTGDSSKRLMCILATNKPEQLDPAVTDRLDMMIEFPLPDEDTRVRLFDYYLKKHLTKNIILSDVEINDIKIDLAKISNGFSAREIAKLCISCEIFGQSNVTNILKKDDIIKIINKIRNQHDVKKNWDISYNRTKLN